MEYLASLENGVNDFLYQIQLYISISKMFFVFVLIALVILLMICINLMQKVNMISKNLGKLLEYNNIREEKEQGYDVTDKRIRELLVLSKSNNKFHADNAKAELELIRQEGEKTNGSNDIGSNEGDNGRG